MENVSEQIEKEMKEWIDAQRQTITVDSDTPIGLVHQPTTHDWIVVIGGNEHAIDETDVVGLFDRLVESDEVELNNTRYTFDRLSKRNLIRVFQDEMDIEVCVGSNTLVELMHVFPDPLDDSDHVWALTIGNIAWGDVIDPHELWMALGRRPFVTIGGIRYFFAANRRTELLRTLRREFPDLPHALLAPEVAAPLAQPVNWKREGF